MTNTKYTDMKQFDLYKQTIHKMPVHFYWKDLQFRYIECNELYANTVGLASPKDIIGQTDFDIFSKSYAHDIRKKDLEVLEKGEPCIFEEEYFKPSHERIIYLTQKMPLLDDKGVVVGLAGISFNITSRKLQEERSLYDKENAEYTLASILDNLPGHVYWKNLDSVFQGCNKAQANSAGFSDKNGVIGKTDYDMPWRNEANALRESDALVMRNRQTLTREEASQLAGSDKISIFLSKKTPLLDKTGAVVGILGISFDITERKDMEEKLRQAKIAAEAANRAKTEFIANMSHDIRTPLTGVIGMSELLENDLKDPETKQYARWLHNSAEQLLQMLNDILDDIKVDNLNEHDIHNERVALRPCIQNLIQLVLPSTKLKHLNIVVHIEEDVPVFIVTDRAKLQRILLNILGNAIKFTQKGSITIKVKCLHVTHEETHIQFSITDTGIGIPKDQQNKVFDRFFRGSPSYKGIYNGQGLGLHIAQAYASLIGGRISLSSMEGVGTTLYLDLCSNGDILSAQNHLLCDTSKTNQPLVVDPATTLQDTHENSPRLLLIEDNPVARKVIESLATKTGCRFVSAANGEEALMLAKNNAFDLIITDIGLPGISGHEFTQKLRQWEAAEEHTHVPIIGLTGHARDAAEKKCIDCGMNDVFSKPTNLAMFQTILNQFVATTHNSLPNISNSTSGKLGLDLPDSEQALFDLNDYSLFDFELALKEIGGDRTLLFSILSDFITILIAEDIPLMEQAYARNDWISVEHLAHKMKGGVVYCGTPRMKLACQYLERYCKAGHSLVRDELYQQLIKITAETHQVIYAWLKNPNV